MQREDNDVAALTADADRCPQPLRTPALSGLLDCPPNLLVRVEHRPDQRSARLAAVVRGDTVRIPAIVHGVRRTPVSEPRYHHLRDEGERQPDVQRPGEHLGRLGEEVELLLPAMRRVEETLLSGKE